MSNKVTTLIQLRAAAGFTQIQLAQRMRVSQGWVSRFERKPLHTMSMRSLSRYLEAIQCKLRLEVEVPKGPTVRIDV